LIDLTGKTFGKGCGIGLGRHGRISQTIGTITPWPIAGKPANAAITILRKILVRFRVIIILPKMRIPDDREICLANEMNAKKIASCRLSRNKSIYF
jgi:hypothetical protein